MSIEEIAIVGFSLFFLASFAILLRRDTYIAGVYLFLYTYTIFAQLGYYYYPELSGRIGAYFGEEVFLSYTIFVALSFLVFFVTVLSCLSLARGVSYRAVQEKASLFGWCFWLAILLHITWTASYFSVNYDLLTYASASDEAFIAEQGLAYLLFGVAFKLSVPIVLILYVLMRLRGKLWMNISARPIPVFLLAEFILFAVIASRLANRTDVLAIMLGVCMFEYKLSGGMRKFAQLTAFVAAVLYGLILIEGSRFTEPVEQLFHEAVLFQDYFGPAHILFAVIHHNFIDPIEAFTSNVLNALFQFSYPYLQATVTELFNPGVSTRSASYAFYIFSEGFVVMGPAGFLYNGVIVGFGVLFWRALAASDSKAYNLFMLALVSTQMANIARGQSSYFIKDLYVYFLPSMILFFLATGLRPGLFPLRRTSLPKSSIPGSVNHLPA